MDTRINMFNGGRLPSLRFSIEGFSDLKYTPTDYGLFLLTSLRQLRNPVCLSNLKISHSIENVKPLSNSPIVLLRRSSVEVSNKLTDSNKLT